jgi:metal-sulfur cluster biosynthetic enzyme
MSINSSGCDPLYDSCITNAALSRSSDDQHWEPPHAGAGAVHPAPGEQTDGGVSTMSGEHDVPDVPDAPAYPYHGPPALQRPIESALRRVVDPEVAMSIVDVGLVYAVTIDGDRLVLLLTMTSPACPVADVIVDDIHAELARVLPAPTEIEIELVWEPPWTPERMSPQAKAFMGW